MGQQICKFFIKLLDILKLYLEQQNKVINAKTYFFSNLNKVVYVHD